jgi:hypothetical protein
MRERPVSEVLQASSFDAQVRASVAYSMESIEVFRELGYLEGAVLAAD